MSLYQVLSDQNGKQLLKLPKYTLLDNFPIELWETIAKYMYPSFALGFDTHNYEGYEQVTLENFTYTIKQIFMEYINNNKIYTLDNTNSTRFLMIDNKRLVINNYCVYTVDTQKNSESNIYRDSHHAIIIPTRIVNVDTADYPIISHKPDPKTTIHLFMSKLFL
jgi:hypothetical protein